MEVNDIFIHQSLHGYKNGHKLLASSTELSDDEKRLMVELSDYSGSGTEKGFNSYLTGYPTLSSKYFVFAKTWYAEEMKRPGCVWTHSLIIDFTHLWEIKDMRELLSHFSRPEGDQDNYLLYSEPIQLTNKARATPDDQLTESFFQISCEFYGNPGKSLVILSESSNTYENEILQLWNWQWPRMKRNFSFSTGSLSLRRNNDEPFHLQVVPYRRARSIDDGEFIKIVDIPQTQCENAWLNAYRKANLAKLQNFMVKYGADMPSAKGVFIALLSAYEMTRTKTLSLPNVERFIMSNFSKATEAKVLKTFLIDELINDSTTDKCNVIKLTLYNQSLNDIDWNYPEIIIGLWKRKKVSNDNVKALISDLLKLQRFSNVVALLKSLPTDLWYDITLSENIYTELLEHSPALQKESLLWQSRQSETIFFNALTKVKRVDWGAVTTAMLDAGSEIHYEEVFSRGGVTIIYTLIDWMAATDRFVTPNWILLIRQNQEAFFTGLYEKGKLSQSLTKLASNVLTPSQKFWKKLPSEYFEKFLSMIDATGLEPQTTGIYTSLLTAVYDNNIANPLHLNNLVFQSLHDRMRNNIVDQDAWERFKWTVGRDLYGLIEQNYVSKIFNDRNRIPDWDRCEFLRRALIAMFLKYDWNPMNIVVAVRDKYTFERIVDFAIEIHDGHEMLAKVYRKLKSSGVDSFHQKVLKNAL